MGKTQTFFTKINLNRKKKVGKKESVVGWAIVPKFN